MSHALSTETCAVLDLGSTSIKAGFAGEDHPSVLVPTAFARARQTRVSPRSSGHPGKTLAETGNWGDRLGSGKRASSSAGTTHGIVGIGDHSRLLLGKKKLEEHINNDLPLEHPIVQGRVEDWKGLERIWEHTFDEELGFDAETGCVFLTNAPFCPTSDRERMAEIMFSQFNARGVYLGSKAVMSLFSTGRTRGVVTQVGGGQTSVVPVFEGFPLQHAFQTSPIAGVDLTKSLAEMLDMSLPHDVVRQVKEKTCWVRHPKASLASPHRPSFDASRKQGQNVSGGGASVEGGTGAIDAAGLRYGNEEEDERVETHVRSSFRTQVLPGEAEKGPVSFELPDGQIVDVSVRAQTMIPESLFAKSANPSSNKIVEAPRDLPSLCMQSINACDKTLQRDLLGSVVIAGGSSMFPGFAPRLEAELITLAGPSGMGPVSVIPDSQRRHASWIGASMLASLDTFSQMAISRQEWEEHGSRIVRAKCLQ